jgi:murein DD-endopeptidase MepM/ murein hydrolase activator NlpD
MIKNYGQVNSSYALSRASLQSKATGATSTADLLSSFKEILSTMTKMNSLSSTSGQTNSSGMSELIAPLMLILLERLVEQQLDQSATSTETTSTSSAAAKQGAQPEPSGRPVGGVLTQDFHPGHNGLDFGVVVGTPIEATMDGKVIHAGWNDQGYGNLVIVENGSYRTYYAHLSSIPVSVGEMVTAGSTIGLSGNTGHSTGPHLHYEIRKNNVPIDPTSVTLSA